MPTDGSSPRHGVIAAILAASANNRFLVLFVVAAALAAGAVSLGRVKLDAIPDLTETQVIVFTEWMGRSPTLVEDQVTYPIVSQLISAPHVSDVRGFSMFGMSFVYVLFDEGTDLYWAHSRVNEYLGGLRARLPGDADPRLGPDATGIGWVFQYALTDTSGKHGLDELRTFQDYTLRYALASVPGVAEVASVGGYEKQYQVVVDPARLKARGLGLNDVAQAIRDSNNDVGGRSIEMSGREYYVRGRGYIEDLGGIEKIALRARDDTGTPVRVSDVATVHIGPDIRRGIMDWNGEGEAVGGIVIMRSGENALEVITRTKQKIAELQSAFPEGVQLHIAYDRGDLIERSISTLKGALVEELIVVSLVILLFLLHFRSSLLAILIIPASVLLGFIPMALLDIPSTIMSLGGIAIAIGATVDAVIVMIEACHKKLEEAPPGRPRRELLIEAASEVTPAIFFSLLIIAVAFLPVFALEGQAGKLFKPLAYTKTFVMLASAMLSITLAPALLDVLIRGRIHKETEHPISRLLIRVYRPFVFVAMKRPLSTIAIGLFAVASAVPMGLRLGHEFMPALNEGDVLYMPITFPNISIEEAKRQLQLQDAALMEFPEVQSVFGKIGRAESATDPAPLTMVETTVRLKPVEDWRMVSVQRWYAGLPEALHGPLRLLWPDTRRINWDELTAEMDRALQLPGWTNAWTMPIKTRIDMMTTGIRTPIGVKVFGPRLDDIEAAGEALERVLSRVPGTRSAVYERSLGGLYVDITPDRDAIARYGLTVGDINRVVEAAVGGMPVTRTVEGRARFSVNVRYPQDVRDDVEKLKALPVDAGSGRVLPLGELARVGIVGGPPMVRDEDGLLVGYVYVDIDMHSVDIGGYVDSAKAAVDNARAAGELKMPPGQYLKWTGQYELLEAMAARMKVLVPLTLVLVLLLLWLQFRRLTDVFLIMLSIPFALVGSVWLLALLDYRLSTAVWVGVIALAGLAAQTGIVMLVYIRHALDDRARRGLLHTFDDVVAAHMEGTVQRVRPKLMTVTTMLMGLVPLLWATGSGADVMKRVAAPMVGGLVTSAFLTLEIIPVISVYLTWYALRRQQRVNVRLGD